MAQCNQSRVQDSRVSLLLIPVLFIFSHVGIAQGPAVSSNPAVLLPAVTYGSGGVGTYAVVVADVSGDGKPDLISVNYCGTDPACLTDGSVSVLLGKGDGAFQAAVAYHSGGPRPTAVAVADVNGDRRPDIIVPNYSNTVGVLLGNGDGTFQPVVTYPTGDTDVGLPDSVAIADVNGDGKPDLVVTNFTGQSYLSKQVSVLFGNGDGTFQAAVQYASGGLVPYSVAVADVNRDGKPDLLVANWLASSQNPGHGTVGVLLGNGDGTFLPATAYDSGGNLPYSIAITDINQDGKPDIVAANCAPTGSYACPNFGGSGGRGIIGVSLGNGDGTFKSTTTYDSGGLYATSVAIADVNADNKLDLVVSNICATNNCAPGHSRGGVGALLGNGVGSFQPAITFDSGGDGSWSIAAKDVNGDNQPDLIVANQFSSNLAVLLNNTKDVTPPAINTSITPKFLRPADGKMVPVHIYGTMNDTGSGIKPGSAEFAVTDEYQRVQPFGKITLDSKGHYSFTIQLQASREAADLDGRAYTIRISARDNAGNRMSKWVQVRVPHGD